MKTKILFAIIISSVAGGSALLSSCGERVYYDRPGYPTSYSTGVLDAEGFPIFGYQNSRPVYAFTSMGTPVYNKMAIRGNYYVPKWEPSTEFKGKYYYPKGVKRVDSLPHKSNGWAPPVFDADKPTINHPTKPNPYREPERWTNRYRR